MPNRSEAASPPTSRHPTPAPGAGSEQRPSPHCKSATPTRIATAIAPTITRHLIRPSPLTLTAAPLAATLHATDQAVNPTKMCLYRARTQPQTQRREQLPIRPKACARRGPTSVVARPSKQQPGRRDCVRRHGRRASTTLRDRIRLRGGVGRRAPGDALRRTRSGGLQPLFLFKRSHSCSRRRRASDPLTDEALAPGARDLAQRPTIAPAQDRRRDSDRRRVWSCGKAASGRQSVRMSSTSRRPLADQQGSRVGRLPGTRASTKAGVRHEHRGRIDVVGGSSEVVLCERWRLVGPPASALRG